MIRRRRRRLQLPVVEHIYDSTATVHWRWLDAEWWRVLRAVKE